MLSNELSTYVAVFGAFNLAVLSIFAWRIARMLASSRALASYIHNQNKNAVSLRQIAELSSEVTQLKDAYDALLESHKKLRSRIGMRKTREKRSNGVDSDAVPADESARVVYKNQLRAKLKQEGRL